MNSIHLGYDFALLKEVQRINREAQERFVNKVQKELWIVKGKTIAVWGLSFKPDTDDLRDSVVLAVATRLSVMGAKLRVYDPQAMAKARPLLEEAIFCESAMEAVKGSDCALLLTDWPEFLRLDLKKVKKAMAHPTLIDGRNFFDPVKVRRLGFTYRSVGRP